MKRLIARSEAALVVILTMVAAMCTVSTASAASSTSAATRAPAVSSTQCNFVCSRRTCESTDPTAAYYDSPTGNITNCTFVFNVAWGDGSSNTTKTITNPSASHHLVGEHTYKGPKVYTITVTVKVTVGPCTATNSVHTFTLLAPPLPPSGSTLVKNYAGYSAGPLAGTDLYVQANWIVPKVDCSGAPGKNYTRRAAVWVGMWGPKWLWQAGTNSQCTKKATQYYAWYELVLNGPHTLKGITVHDGDSISLRVHMLGESSMAGLSSGTMLLTKVPASRKMTS